MKLDELMRADATKVIRWWADDGGEGDGAYISAEDCPSKEAALAYYAEVVGQEWESEYLDDVQLVTIPCCDHDGSECDRDPISHRCNNAVMQECWAFEV